MFNITWDLGTAYDFFVSLHVLHRPADFGLRPSWAAGVRSRLPLAQREIIEKAQSFLFVPLPFLYQLNATQKNVDVMLAGLGQLPPAEILPVLSFHPESSSKIKEVLLQIAKDGCFSAAQVESIRAEAAQRGVTYRASVLHDLCTAWSDAESFGGQYLKALRIYQQNFFVEEEERIAPALENGLKSAQMLAESMTEDDLLSELSRGVHFEALPKVSNLILTPSYWSTPLVFYRKVNANSMLMLFGCRASHQTLVPGESVPDGVVSVLRALDDPTRLRILRYLAEELQTPSELSRRLRLRPPTVVHHLGVLRLAGLVEVTVLAEGERRYAMRHAALNTAIGDVERFVFQGKKLDE